ncbi:MAG: hypothetical protein ACE5LS_02110 [Thermoplasmata archaeon]
MRGKMTTHGDVLKRAGIQVIRLDVRLPSEDDGLSLKRVEELTRCGLKVMAIAKSDCFAPYRHATWEVGWREYVERLVRKFHPHVSFWQVENELNHPYHNRRASRRADVREKLLKEGCGAVKQANRQAETIVNLYWHLGREEYLRQLTSLRNAGCPIDILGIDVYRGPWAFGDPSDYPDDIDRARLVWHGPILISETGYAAWRPWKTEAGQVRYFDRLFGAVHRGFLQSRPWFLGTIVYVYGCTRLSITPERRFGLLRRDGTERPVWRKIVQEARHMANERLFGVTSHVNEFDDTGICPPRNRRISWNRN